MPIEVYVAPADGSGAPLWWQITDHEGLSVSGAFAWSATAQPPDDVRHDGYRVPYGEPVPTWRPANRDEAVAALWASCVGPDAREEV